MDQLLYQLVPGAFFAWLFSAWIFRRHRQRASGAVPDEPLGTPYRIYTTEFDRQITASQIPELSGPANPDFYRNWTDRNGERWSRAKDLVKTAQEKQEKQVLPKSVIDILRGMASNSAISILIDQSGSMKGEPMAAVIAAVKYLSRAMVEAEINHEILGFSTVGWQGGQAYQKWKSNGRPKRPGRLCALLHIIYKTLDDAVLSEDAIANMSCPDILRENIDGEAIGWAAKRLEFASAENKFVIVISDGAPVDDATLQHNGLSYLTRDLVRTLEALSTKTTTRVGAVDVGETAYAHDYYVHCTHTPLNDIPMQTLALLKKMAKVD